MSASQTDTHFSHSEINKIQHIFFNVHSRVGFAFLLRSSFMTFLIVNKRQRTEGVVLCSTQNEISLVFFVLGVKFKMCHRAEGAAAAVHVSNSYVRLDLTKPSCSAMHMLLNQIQFMMMRYGWSKQRAAKLKQSLSRLEHVSEQ